jgi:antitoxin component of MazEF toxin-antitoxin module
MTVQNIGVARDFGEVPLSGDGRLTVPNALLQMFHLSGGDRVRFETDDEGRIVLTTRKRRRLVDIARANAFTIGETGRDIDALIDEAVAEAMAEQEARARNESGA